MGVPDGSLGISQANIAAGSLLSLKQETLHYIAASDDYWVNGAACDNTSVVGDTATIVAANADTLLAHPDFVRLVPIDASGTSLSLTVLVTGYLRGKVVTDSITASGTTAAVGDQLMDQVTSVEITALSNNASGDTYDVGFSGTAAGTRLGVFDNINHVKCAIHHRQQGNVNVLDVLDSSSINASQSAFLWAGLATTVAAGDTVTLYYYAKPGLDGWHRRGRMADS